MKKGSSIKDVLAKSDFLDTLPPPVWQTPPLDPKYIAIRTPVGGGGFGLQYGLPKRQKKLFLDVRLIAEPKKGGM